MLNKNLRDILNSMALEDILDGYFTQNKSYIEKMDKQPLIARFKEYFEDEFDFIRLKESVDDIYVSGLYTGFQTGIDLAMKFNGMDAVYTDLDLYHK